MVKKIDPFKVITKEGEVKLSISLDLNININADGQISATVVGQESKSAKEDDKVEYIIPDFTSHKIKFGQDVEKLKEI